MGGWVGRWEWGKSKINDTKNKALTMGGFRGGGNQNTNIIVCGLHFKANKSKENK